MKPLLTFIFQFLSLAIIGQSLSLDHLRCEYKENPIIDVMEPRLSWQLKVEEKDKNIMQQAYQIQVASDSNQLKKENRLIWDSGKIRSDQSVHVAYQGPEVRSQERYYWRVKVWDNQNRESPWSKIQYWEMGLLSTQEWHAKWIRPAWEEKPRTLNPPFMLRKEFSLNKRIKSAKLYSTAHGIYEASINGQKISEDLFAPGWTSYHKRIQYQCYDVTKFVKPGNNAIGIYLADGWYRGNFGFGHNWDPYGTQTAFLGQIEIEYQNGKKDLITSDESWKATIGPIKMSSFYQGETYDARDEKPGWDTSNYKDIDWKKVETVEATEATLICPESPPVRRIEELAPIAVFRSPKNELIVDFGQNLVGRVKIKVKGSRGDTILIRHAEVLDEKGNFYVDNIRSAQQKVTYILKGSDEEIYEPNFSFQGFRYVKIQGINGNIEKENIKAIVIHTDLPKTGSFECSNPLINKLQENIVWSQKGNYLEIPTDCPQRDERMGWTGDVLAFVSTGCFNYESFSFLSKWLRDLKADQLENGSVPYVIPDVHYKNGSTGWGDAATIVPWTLYLKYGDKRILERQYSSMKAWVSYLSNLAGDDFLLQEGFHFGDWMFFIHPWENDIRTGYTDKDFFATAFFARSTYLTAKTAEVLGDVEEQKQMEEQFEKIKKAFQQEFVTRTGRLSPHSQTAYVLALAFHLMEESQISKAVGYLSQHIKNAEYHPSTGFHGTPLLCTVLSENGESNIAYRLLTQESFPSWLYQVKQGATTIWERWDGIKPDGSYQIPRVNSFNHYGRGSIGNWMYTVTAGIQHDDEQPGYKHIILKPEPDPLLEFVKAEYQSLYGTIKSSWQFENANINISVRIPPNSTATLFLPGHPTEKEGIELGSGSYQYSYKIEEK